VSHKEVLMAKDLVFLPPAYNAKAAEAGAKDVGK
jgi:hypothetical protein